MAGSCAALAAVGLHLMSWHPQDHNGELESVTPGAYARAECELLGGQPQLGAFDNSLGWPSVYAGLQFELDRHAVFTPFVLVGGITGYTDEPVLPLLHVGLRLGPFSDDLPMALGIGYSPPCGDGCGAHVVHAAIEWRF